MLNIVVPMAGRGSRFAVAGFLDPKPLIPIHDVPMIRWVIRNLTPEIEHKFIFIAQAEHIEKYGLAEKLQEWSPRSSLIPVHGVTTGAAATVLAAREIIATNDPLMIANSDQWIERDIQEFLSFLAAETFDGSILTMEADDPKWSYIENSPDGSVKRVVEKEVISNMATVGIYAYRNGTDFVKFADQMIKEDFRVNGEHYVAPVYNWMIQAGHKITSHLIGSELDGMFGLGIPEDLRKFEQSEASRGVWQK